MDSMASSQWLAPLSPLPLPPCLTPTPPQLKGMEEEEVVKRGLRGREREVQTEERREAKEDPRVKRADRKSVV